MVGHLLRIHGIKKEGGKMKEERRKGEKKEERRTRGRKGRWVGGLNLLHKHQRHRNRR